jgi:hypothetical protein
MRILRDAVYRVEFSPGRKRRLPSASPAYFIFRRAVPPRFPPPDAVAATPDTTTKW